MSLSSEESSSSSTWVLLGSCLSGFGLFGTGGLCGCRCDDDDDDSEDEEETDKWSLSSTKEVGRCRLAFLLVFLRLLLSGRRREPCWSRRRFEGILEETE